MKWGMLPIAPAKKFGTGSGQDRQCWKIDNALFQNGFAFFDLYKLLVKENSLF